MQNYSVSDLIALGDKLFSERLTLLSYWQCVAENFYPQRADFTSMRVAGEEPMGHLSTSYPVLARQELANVFSGMLRPKGEDWFSLAAAREDLVDVDDGEAKEWMEWAAGTQRRAMYDNLSGFVRATKEADHDYATFGQAVISVELAPSRDRLLFRCWHLRDVAWQEGVTGQVDTVFRKWKPTATELNQAFPGKIHKAVEDLIRNKTPYATVNVLHAVVPTPDARQPWRSVYIDVDNQHAMEDVGSWSLIYTIMRWQTVSGSQYAHSPSVVAALPDARLIQSVSLTLLDAGEMYTAPPMLATQDAIRGDIDLTPRGITWVDPKYDERLGEVLRPLNQDRHGYPIGDAIREEARAMIAQAFFLNKLELPPTNTGDMTAFEVSQRVQENIRQTLPLFEPLEDEYNAALCEATFELGMRHGMFGPVDFIPDSLQEQSIEFRFVSPLTQSRDRKSANTFLEAKGLLLQAAELQVVQDQAPSTQMFNASDALRAALEGIGVEAKHILSDEDVGQIQADARAMQEEQAAVSNVAQGVDIAAKAGQAAQSLGLVEAA